MTTEQAQVVLKDSATPQGMAAIALVWEKKYSDLELFAINYVVESGGLVLALTLRRGTNSVSKATL